MSKTNVTVVLDLDGEGGNAFAVMGKVIQALKKNGHSDLVKAYQTEAMSGDYDNLLKVTREYVNVELY